MSRVLPSRPSRCCWLLLCCGVFSPLWLKFNRSNSYSAARGSSHAQLEEMEFELDGLSSAPYPDASDDDGILGEFRIDVESEEEEMDGINEFISEESNSSASAMDLCRSVISALDRRESLSGKVTENSVKLIFDAIGTRGLSIICQRLYDDRNIRTIEFGINNIGSSASLIELQKLLSLNPVLTSLAIWGNGISDSAAASIARGIAENSKSSLHFLSLANNEISDPGVRSISTVLGQLRHLDLSGNAVSDTGFAAIAKAISASKLEFLNISTNRLTNKSASMVAEFLPSNSSLDSLDFSTNLLDDEGISEICRALQQNKTLTQLNIASNKLSSVGRKSIQAALKHAKSAKLHRLIITEVNENLSLGLGSMNGAASEAESSDNHNSNGNGNINGNGNGSSNNSK